MLKVRCAHACTHTHNPRPSPPHPPPPPQGREIAERVKEADEAALGQFVYRGGGSGAGNQTLASGLILTTKQSGGEGSDQTE